MTGRSESEENRDVGLTAREPVADAHEVDAPIGVEPARHGADAGAVNPHDEADVGTPAEAESSAPPAPADERTDAPGPVAGRDATADAPEPTGDAPEPAEADPEPADGPESTAPTESTVPAERADDATATGSDPTPVVIGARGPAGDYVTPPRRPRLAGRHGTVEERSAEATAEPVPRTPPVAPFEGRRARRARAIHDAWPREWERARAAEPASTGENTVPGEAMSAGRAASTARRGPDAGEPSQPVAASTLPAGGAGRADSDAPTGSAPTDASRAAVSADTAGHADAAAGEPDGPGGSSSGGNADAGDGGANGTPPPPQRGLARRAVTLAVGLVAVLAVAAVAVGGDRLPRSEPTPAARAATVDVTSTAQSWVCPRPAQLSDASASGELGSSPVATVSTFQVIALGSATTGVANLDGSASTTFDDRSSPAAATRSAKGPTVITATGATAGRLVAGTVGSTTTAGDLRGLAAGSCEQPAASQWLVGGSTSVGQSTQLVVQNPGKTVAAVQVQVWGQSGAYALGSGASLVVGPGQQKVTLLEAGAPDQRRLVVHVTSTGGEVSAYLQHNLLDGIVPQGVEFVMPSAEPVTSIAVPGVTSVGEAIGDARAPQLRLLVPGAKGARVDVTVYGPQGRVTTRGLTDVHLDAGVVTDLSLGGLPAGTYTVAVTSTVPIVGGAYEQRRGPVDSRLSKDEAQYDLAYAQAVALPRDGAGAEGSSIVALVPNTVSTVQLAAVPRPIAKNGAVSTDHGALSGKVSATVTAYGADGARLGEKTVSASAGTTVDVAAASVAQRQVAALTVTSTDGTAGLGLVWNVRATAGTGNAKETLISLLAPVTGAEEGQQVVVRPGD